MEDQQSAVDVTMGDDQSDIDLTVGEEQAHNMGDPKSPIDHDSTATLTAPSTRPQMYPPNAIFAGSTLPDLHLRTHIFGLCSVTSSEVSQTKMAGFCRNSSSFNICLRTSELPDMAHVLQPQELFQRFGEYTYGIPAGKRYVVLDKDTKFDHILEYKEEQLRAAFMARALESRGPSPTSTQPLPLL